MGQYSALYTSSEIKSPTKASGDGAEVPRDHLNAWMMLGQLARYDKAEKVLQIMT